MTHFPLEQHRRRNDWLFVTYMCYILSHSGWYQMAQRFKDKKTPKTTADDDGASQDNGLSLEDILTSRLRMTLGKELDPRRSPNHGSFYLRMGAVGMNI